MIRARLSFLEARIIGIVEHVFQKMLEWIHVYDCARNAQKTFGLCEIYVWGSYPKISQCVVKNHRQGWLKLQGVGLD